MNTMNLTQMMYRNVIYKEYIDCNIKELGDCAKNFIEISESYGVNKNGPLILIYTQFMKDEQVNVTFMLPVDQPFVPDLDLGFRTYFYIDDMIEARLRSSNYEIEEKEVLSEIESFVKENNLKRISPYYQIINHVNGLIWVDIKVKIKERF